MPTGIYKHKPHSEETKSKIKKTNIKRFSSKKIRDRISTSLKGNKNCLGKAHSQKTKDKISISLIGHQNTPSGVDSPQWKGGKSEAQKRYWRTEKGRLLSEKYKEADFDYIYNSWFKGSVLHHLRYIFPVIGMYIPEEMHRPYTRNLVEANTAAFNWYLKR